MTHERFAQMYICLDVELDGQAPGLSSMLSFAAVAVANSATIATFTANLQPLPEGNQDPVTMAWWSSHSDEWDLARGDVRPAVEVIPQCVAWLDSLPSDCLVAVGAPAATDFAFVNYYCHRFAGRNPLGYSCLDLLSLAMGHLGAHDHNYCDLEDQGLEDVLGFAADPALRVHVALDDATQQARLLIALLGP